MTTFVFDIVASGNWSSQADWTSYATGKPNSGVPGASDVALIYADGAIGPTTVVTGDEQVAAVHSSGNGTVYLEGSGLNVSGDMTGVRLSTGKYVVNGVAGAVFVDTGAELSGGAIGGTGSSGGVTIDGGKVTGSNSFWGNLTSGSVVTSKLLNVSVSGGTLQAASMILANFRAAIISGGVTTVSTSVVVSSAGLPGGVTISGGVFTDNGSLTLGGQVPSQSYERGSFTASGGKQAVLGATVVGNYGALNVSGKSVSHLWKGLSVGNASGATGYVDVGSPVAAGGDLVVSGGNCLLGGAGNAKVLVFFDGKFDSSLSNVTLGKNATSKSTLTIESGGSMVAKGLVVAQFGQAAVAVSAAGSLTVLDTLEVDAAAGAKGSVSVTGAGSKITAAALGGTGTVAISGGAVLDIGNSAAASSTVSFSGAGDLLLMRAEDFHAHVAHFGKGDTVTLSGFQALSQPLGFYENTAHTEATITVTDGGRLAHIVFDGSFVASDFRFNAATSQLTFV